MSRKLENRAANYIMFDILKEVETKEVPMLVVVLQSGLSVGQVCVWPGSKLATVTSPDGLVTGWPPCSHGPLQHLSSNRSFNRINTQR